jgi:acylphosphatase
MMAGEGRSAMDAIETVRVRVTGRVQGVAYRAWAAGAARGLGLSGWVRNDDDGAVVALLSGPLPAVERMLAAMRAGPPDARVRDLSSAPCDETPPAGFVIRR